MTDPVVIGAGPVRVRDVVAVARGGAALALAEDGRARIAASHAALGRIVGSGVAIYGVSTGLGAAVDTSVAPSGTHTQHRIPLARSVGVGRLAAHEEVRAMMAARVARFAKGCSGCSIETVEALIGLLNHRVYPAVPMIGSIGEADLAPLAHIAAVLVGYGEAAVGGSRMAGSAALRLAGLDRLELGAKDGLALVSSNAASVGLAALAVADVRRALAGLLAATCLSFEGYRANLAPLLPQATALRPVPGQDGVACAMLAAFSGGDLGLPGVARQLQDPLSFRCAGVVHGAAAAALAAATSSVELELNSSDDNAAILADSETPVPNANFDTTHLALAFESLGLALARAAAAAAERIMKLTSPSFSGLPRFLAAVQDGRNGFATVQKTVAALVAQIQHCANPMPVVLTPVADRTEDYGTMALGTIEKTAEIAALLRFMAAIELMVAAQACDLRAAIVLGSGTQAVFAQVRRVVARLDEDRPAAPDIAALNTLILGGAFDAGFALPAGTD